jgi:ABC-2 type transport system permease protein
MNWVSPVQLNNDENQDRETTVLLNSSNNAWTSTSTNIQPDFELYPETGFAVGETKSSYPLAVSIQGSFDSYFRDKPIPTITSEDGTETTNPGLATINQSSSESRLVIFGSSGFIDDLPLQLSSQLTQDYVVNNLRLIQNAVDWSVEDTDLLSIRSRGSATRVLIPLDAKQQTFWEISIYIIEAVLLFGLYGYWQIRNRKNKSRNILLMDAGTPEKGASNE